MHANAATAVLDYLGGVMSPEMATPKLMWLKRQSAGKLERSRLSIRPRRFPDLEGDRLAGALAMHADRKWTYLAHEKTGWQARFLRDGRAGRLLERGNLPEKASPVGADLGPLTAEAAAELGLTEKCRVGAGVIDAYAGALGVLGGFAGDRQSSTGIWR